MSKTIIRALLIAATFLVAPNFVSAGKYFDEAEKNAYSVPDCDAVKNPTCKTFYIDGANGNDAWNGLSANFVSGTTGPFKTIGKALDRYSSRMKGGNVFKIKAGLYRERVSIGNVTGNIGEDTRFVVGSYGDGEVIIDGSDSHLITWSSFTENLQIYVGDYSSVRLSSAPAVPQAIILDDDFKSCRPVDSLDQVTSYGRWFYDTASQKIYINTNGINPTSKDVIVVKFDEDNVQYGVYATGVNYLTVAGLTVRGASAYGMYFTGDNVRLLNNEFKFNDKGGVSSGNGRYAEFFKNHIYGTCLLNWPRGNRWGSTGGWPGAFASKFNVHMKGNISHDNGGEGLTAVNDGLVEDNIVYDNYSVNYYTLNGGNNIFRNNISYSTGIDVSDVVDDGHIPGGSTRDGIIRRLRPEGIMTGDESANNPVATAFNDQIYNNLIINCRRGYTHYGQSTGSGLVNYVIANNTIIVPPEAGTGESFVGMTVPYNNGNNINSIIKNNIIIASHPDSQVFKGPILPTPSTDPGFVMNNNLFYHSGRSDAINWNNGNYDFAGYQLISGQDSAGLFADAKLANVAFLQAIDKNTAYADIINAANIIAGSPAINTGAVVGENISDFSGNDRPMGAGYDIGAFEYVELAGDITAPNVPNGVNVE